MNNPKDFEQIILKDRLDSLHKSITNASITTVPIASIYSLLHLKSHHWAIPICWILLIITIYVIRYIITKRYKSTRSLQQQLMIFRIGLWATGITFGSVSFLFYPTDSPQMQLLTITMLLGLSAGSLTLLSADRSSYTVYDICTLLPGIMVFISYGDRVHYTMALMFIAFLAATLLACKSLNQMLISSLKLRYENISLVNRLKKEKNLLDNRLGRILNDSLNELYILHGETLACIQMNKGAIKNLGYSKNELAEMTLLDIVTTLDKEGFNKLISPLWDGTREAVVYEGYQTRKDGSRYPVEINMQLATMENPPVLVATSTDISKRKAAEQELFTQANYDQLTKLPNRHYMNAFINNAFSHADRNKTKVALLFLDLNNFKDINDSMGHAMGDKLLKMVADRLLSVLRGSDTPARFGGDEFLIVLEGIKQQSQADIVVYKILNSLQKPFTLNEQEISTSASVGISIYPDDGNSVDLLLQYADTAMYSAKKGNGNSKYQFFSQKMCQTIAEQQNIKNRLQHAIKNHELSVYYQPKVDVQNNIIIGAEALLRWKNPILGKVPPFTFIPIAEKYGLIDNIGKWVLEEACKEANLWQTIVNREVHISVNISPQQFQSNNLLEHIDYALAQSGLPSKLLEAEITESLLLQDTEEPLIVLKELRNRDIKLSLDDFGTGYSALSYLGRFPLQVLKIDKSFISNLFENRPNRALVEAIITMAHSLEMELVAEGVENKDQLEFLREKNVTVVQGYLFSRPVPADDFRELLVSGSLPAT
jgi:diguanylate cyclase (GGDEF)-like protein/PAS domain S-box-containing protein